MILRSFEAHCQDGETHTNLYKDFRPRGVTSKALTTGIDEVVYSAFTASLEYRLEGNPEGTSGGISYIFSYIFYSSIKTITEAIYKWFYFLSTASI